MMNEITREDAEKAFATIHGYCVGKDCEECGISVCCAAFLKGFPDRNWSPQFFTRADKEVTEVSDVIHGPSHYSWRECGESLGFIKRFISNQPDSFLAFCEGNVFKYLYRYPKKNGVEDLKKAREYLNRMIEHMEDEK